ncbi:MAG: ADP compounds hydrolase NudE [Pseudomonadota bacterium]|nr:MAG: ADP compounds hydrolase NudE [Pseudomonadota bacterium]
MKQLPRILRTSTLAKTRMFRIEQLDLEFANGTVVPYERLRSAGNGAVLVVPMLDPGTVLLIREYAAGVGRYELGLPKGRIEDGEDILEAANREIQEEIGYGATRLQHIRSLSLAPGYIDHCTHVVLAQDLYPERRSGDEPEEIEVVPWRLDDIPSLLARDDANEARSIAALFLVREMLADG